MSDLSMSSHHVDKTYLERAFREGRDSLPPIITSLNGDNSWLISFPRPLDERIATGRAFYHVVSDPWFTGHFNVGHIFITVTMTTPPITKDGAGVLEMIHEIDQAATSAGITSLTSEPSIDAIFIHRAGVDHLNKASLLTFDPNIPVFTIPSGVHQLKHFHHFKTIVPTVQPEKSADSWDWRSLHPGKPLPDWLNVIPLDGDVSNFSWAIIYDNGLGTDSKPEAIISTPHGQSGVHPATKLFPSVNIRASMWPVKDNIALGTQYVFGPKWGLDVHVDQLKAKWFVPTHSATFKYGGLVGGATTDTFISPEEALAQKGWSKDRLPYIARVGHGEAFVLT